MHLSKLQPKIIHSSVYQKIKTSPGLTPYYSRALGTNKLYELLSSYLQSLIQNELRDFENELKCDTFLTKREAGGKPST